MLSHDFMGLSSAIEKKMWRRQSQGVPKSSGRMNEREVAICRRVKHIRNMIKWPQPAFAHELGVSTNQLASVEYCRTPLRYGLAYRIAMLFDVSVRWLATGVGEVKPFSSGDGCPLPGNISPKMLLSKAYELGPERIAIETGLTLEDQKADRGSVEEPGYDFGVANQIMRVVHEILGRDCFRSKLVCIDFAQHAENLLRTLALNYRRAALAQKVKSIQEPKSDGESSHVSIDKALQIMRINARISELEIYISGLNAKD